MKFKILFSGKNKKIISKWLLLIVFTQHAKRKEEPVAQKVYNAAPVHGSGRVGSVILSSLYVVLFYLTATMIEYDRSFNMPCQCRESADQLCKTRNGTFFVRRYCLYSIQWKSN